MASLLYTVLCLTLKSRHHRKCMVRHKNAWFDTKMHGSTQKCMVRHKSAWLDKKMHGSTQKCMVRHKSAWLDKKCMVRHKSAWFDTKMHGSTKNAWFDTKCTVDTKTRKRWFDIKSMGYIYPITIYYNILIISWGMKCRIELSRICATF